MVELSRWLDFCSIFAAAFIMLIVKEEAEAGDNQKNHRHMYS
jgi:hypothetical protein